MNAYKTRYRTLKNIEADLSKAMAQMESAPDENTAAQAYHNLRNFMREYISEAEKTNKERWNLRNTTIRQAKTIAAHDLDQLGAAATQAPSTSQQHFNFSQPDTITVQNSPDFFFIRLSYGLINIRHIVELDVNARTLHTTQSSRQNLSKEDVLKLIALLKLYPSPQITKLTGSGLPACRTGRQRIQNTKTTKIQQL
ncbi:MAG TPA: hypothetical protein ENJ95_03495 [Bacteroidetes bacterium]|nr:hypothetical protein [Bacteroidota bacterium]